MARIPRKSSKSIAKCTIFKQDKVPVFETMSVLRVGMSLLRFCHHQRGGMRGTCVPNVFRRVVVEVVVVVVVFGSFCRTISFPVARRPRKIAHKLMRTKEVPK